MARSNFSKEDFTTRNKEIGLEESTSWNPYSKEFKLAAVQDNLSRQNSLKEVTRKYKSVLRNWIQKYNSHRELNRQIKK